MPKQPQVNVDTIRDMYCIQHLAVRAIGILVGMSGPAVWKRLQAAGVKSDQGEWVELGCHSCGKLLRVTRARWRRTRKLYCSARCYYLDIENPLYNPNRQGQRLARKAVSEVFQLKPKDVVHHEDGNTQNNRLDNLMVFSCQADHMSYHRGGSAVPVWRGDEYKRSVSSEDLELFPELTG